MCFLINKFQFKKFLIFLYSWIICVNCINNRFILRQNNRWKNNNQNEVHHKILPITLVMLLRKMKLNFTFFKILVYRLFANNILQNDNLTRINIVEVGPKYLSNSHNISNKSVCDKSITCKRELSLFIYFCVQFVQWRVNKHNQACSMSNYL